MEENNPDLEPIKLNPTTTTQFEAGGHTYTINREASLSVIRSRWLERFGFYSMHGRNAGTFSVEARRAFDANNGSRPGDVAVILDNLIRGAHDLEKRHKPLLHVCTLFINRQDEDRADYDPELALDKINDWGRIEESFFLQLALGYLKITDLHLTALIQLSLGANLPDLDLLNKPLDPS